MVGPGSVVWPVDVGDSAAGAGRDCEDCCWSSVMRLFLLLLLAREMRMRAERCRDEGEECNC